MDLFVCINDRSTLQNDDFHRFYYNLHSLFGLTPDWIYPGEIVSIDELDTMLVKGSNCAILLDNDEEIFDITFYTKVITGPISFVAGDYLLFCQYKEKFYALRNRFVGLIYDLLLHESKLSREMLEVAVSNNDLDTLCGFIDFEEKKQINRSFTQTQLKEYGIIAYYE